MLVTKSPLDFRVSEGIALLTLDRPDAGNTIDMEMARALVDAAARCESNPEIRCVVLTGQGKLFCGGGDLAAFSEAGDKVASFLNDLASTLHSALSILMRMRKPLITLVNGPAAGAGMSLALAGDIVLASRAARFVPAYGAIGLTPDGGMTWLLPRLVGLRKAQEILLANKNLTAEEALSLGLVTSVVDHDALMNQGMEEAGVLASGAIDAMGGVKDLLLGTFAETYEGQLAREAQAISAAGAGAESREGISAFRAKRTPNFKGNPVV